MHLSDRSITEHSSSQTPHRESSSVFPTPFPPQPWSRSDLFLFLPILVIALLLRLLNLDYMEFKGDEAGNLFVASSLASGTALPLVGIKSSIGTYTPPLFPYLLALPLLFSRNPLVATGFVALLNCAAVGLFYAFCRRFFNQRVAFVAAGFFALNPWAVFYSRKIWQQDLLPLFVVGFFYFLNAVVCEGKRKALVGCFACLAAMTQLHLSSIYYLALLAIVLIRFRPRVGWSDYAIGIGVAALLYAPYLVFELLNRGYNSKVYLHTLNLASHFHPEALTAPFVHGTTFGFWHSFDWPVLDLLQACLIAAGVVYLCFRTKERTHFIALLWLFVPMLFFSMSKLKLYHHYFLAFYPVQFLLLGVLTDALIALLQTKGKVPLYGAVTVLVLLAGYQLQASVKFLHVIRDNQNLSWMEYGPPFQRRVEEIRSLVRQGIVEPQQLQQKLLERKSGELSYKYDFLATRYILLHLSSIP